jgi:hypothetical protein
MSLYPTFMPDSPVTWRHHRLYITTNNGHANLLMMEFEIYVGDTAYPTSNMTSATEPSPLVATTTGTGTVGDAAWGVFTGNTGATNRWYLRSVGFPASVAVDLGDGNGIIPTSWKVQGPNGANPSMAPKDFLLQVSNDDTNWTTLYTVTGQTSWDNEEVRTFTL